MAALPLTFSAARPALGAFAAFAVALVTTPARADCPADAAALYDTARAEFQAGRYDAAAVMLRGVYACEANPIYLYDIARSYEQAGRSEDAIAAWREYGAAVVDPLANQVAQDRISALVKILESRKLVDGGHAKVPSPATTTPPAAVRRSFHVSAGAGVLTAVGLAGIVTGVVFELFAISRHASAVKDSFADGATQLQNDAMTFATIATSSFIVGGIVTAAGVTWATVDLFGPRGAATPHAAIVSIGTRF